MTLVWCQGPFPLSFINPLHVSKTPSQGSCHPATAPPKWRVPPSSAIVSCHMELVIPLLSPQVRKPFSCIHNLYCNRNARIHCPHCGGKRSCIGFLRNAAHGWVVMQENCSFQAACVSDFDSALLCWRKALCAIWHLATGNFQTDLWLGSGKLFGSLLFFWCLF